MKSDLRYESFERTFSIILFAYNVMLRRSKNNKENYLEKAFEERDKESQIKS